MPGVTSTGFEAKALSTIQAEVSAALLSGVSPNLDLSDSTLDGQKIGSISSQIRQLWEAAQDIYAGKDVDQATKDQLTSLLKSVGVFRRPASFSTVNMTITLAAGTYAAGSLVVYVSGDPEARFSNDLEIVTAGATLTDQAFTAEEEGPVRANASTLTQIGNPVTGFSAPTNPLAASLGLEEETDSELYQRWAQSQAADGATTVDAIRADLLALDGVIACTVIENENDTTDANGIGPHGVGVYILGGDDDELALQLWRSKAFGIKTYGTTTTNITNTQGQVKAINYTRPSELRIYVEAEVTVITGQYPATEDDTVEDAIWNAHTGWAGIEDTASSDTWDIGENVIINKIRTAIMRKGGVFDVTALRVDTVSPPVNTANLTVDVDEYADFDLADIDVTLTYINGVP